MLLAGSLDLQELIAGAFVSLLITVRFGSRFAIFTGFIFSWMAPVYVLQYLADFFIALIRANVEMARRILMPSLPIRPEIVEYQGPTAVSAWEVAAGQHDHFDTGSTDCCQFCYRCCA